MSNDIKLKGYRLYAKESGSDIYVPIENATKGDNINTYLPILLDKALQKIRNVLGELNEDSQVEFSPLQEARISDIVKRLNDYMDRISSYSDTKGDRVAKRVKFKKVQVSLKEFNEIIANVIREARNLPPAVD